MFHVEQILRHWTDGARVGTVPTMHPDTEPQDLARVLDEARDLGALGPGPVEDHIAHAQRFVDGLTGVTGRVLDLGSGGGVPGLVIALARPDLQLTLLDAQARRVAFLDHAIEVLGLSTVTTRHARAEVLAHDPGHRGTYGAVTARSFGPPAVVAECAAGFLCTGGRLLVSEPPNQPDRWPSESVEQLGLQVGPRRDGIQVLRASRSCPDRFPRRDGIPTKRPLF